MPPSSNRISADELLLQAAEGARARAYAPYSGFTVGAALAGADGSTFTGANVENASYGLSMCAERTALFTAVASGVRTFDAIAVSGPPGVVTMPCGACRQVLAEHAPDLRVIYRDERGLTYASLADLLPAAFTAGALDAARSRS